jgi:hypothetical protein
VPATEVKLDDGYETLDGVFDLRNREQHLRMAHKAVCRLVSLVLLSADAIACRTGAPVALTS